MKITQCYLMGHVSSARLKWASALVVELNHQILASSYSAIQGKPVVKMIGTIWGTILAILVASCLYLYRYWLKRQNYWKDRGFHEITSKETGGIISNAFKKTHITELDLKMYNILKTRNEPFAGYVEFTNPAVFIKDLELLRQIFIKDFDHFVDHQSFGKDYWSEKMLFFMEGEPWKELRTKMSPTFTTGKIRRMYSIIENCAQRLVTFLEEEIKTSSTVDFTVGYGKYTVDVISSAAFGLESGAFREKKSIFEKMGEDLQFKSASIKDILRFLTLTLQPKLATFLNLSVFDRNACEFFKTAIYSTIKQRRRNSQDKRNDFVQIMLEAREGQLKGEEGELDTFEKEAQVKNAKGKVELTDDMISAQCLIFFLAGFDTTQTLLQFATYQLAVSSEIQEILLKEVTETYEKNGNAFTYESINEMEYMDRFISEVLRMYPPVPRLNRTCTVEYKIPGTNLVIPEGCIITIPAYSIHHDPDIYPDPYRFDPDRFTKEGKGDRSPYAFMPFGHGPRNCIGMRFALTESKLALAHLLRKFVFQPSEKTCIPMKFSDENNFNLRPVGGHWIKLKARV